jgi:hypothetical protein
MPLSWSISHPSSLIHILARGDLEPRQFMSLLQAIDAAKASSYRKLVVVSGVTGTPGAHTLRSLAGTVRRRERERTVGPIAIVADSPAAQRAAGVFMDAARGERLIQTFASEGEARRWLNSFYSFEGQGRVLSQ